MIKKIKKIMHLEFPNTIAFYERLRHFKNRHKSIDDVFTNIYRKNVWKDSESVSGDGSNYTATEKIRNELPGILKKYNIKSMVDAPCGDFHWISKVNLQLEQYVGIDVVQDIIDKNKNLYSDEKHCFEKVDVTSSVPLGADLIFCRDLLVHFSYNNIYKALQNFKLSGSKYILTTTFTNLDNNSDGITGGWRPINLQIAPFWFNKPIDLISEGDPDEYALRFGKQLGLWLLEDIKLNPVKG